MPRLAVRFFWLLIGLLLTAAAAWVAAWMMVLASREPAAHALADWPIFPVACSTRGCVSSAAWQQQQQIQTRFAAAAGVAAPEMTQSLTTAVRQHLVRHSSVRVPATLADARRYREEVLRLTDGAAVERLMGLPLADYDKLVVLPLLQQEAVRLERGAESYDKLFSALASDRVVGILAWHYRWDAGTGSVLPE